MCRAIAIMLCALVFSLVGLGASGLATSNYKAANKPDATLVITFAPPAVGGAFGLFVGCVAVVLGSWTTKRP